MEVILAKPRGFCAGVKRAITIVRQALDKYGAPVYVLHEIVHNTPCHQGTGGKGRSLLKSWRKFPPAPWSFSAPTVFPWPPRSGPGSWACAPSMPPVRWFPRCTAGDAVEPAGLRCPGPWPQGAPGSGGYLRPCHRRGARGVQPGGGVPAPGRRSRGG